jgi:hypothetical protein
MTGSPLAAIFTVLLLLAGLAAALVQIERPRPTVPVETGSSTSREVPSQLRVRFSHMPASASIACGGKILATWQPKDGLDWETTAPIPFAQGLMELSLQASGLPPESPAAVQVQLTPESMAEQNQTLWITSTADEVLQFQWPTP